MKQSWMPSPATLISLVALFVALGGTAYAVATVDSRDVVNDSLRGIDVKNGSLSTSDVKNESLTSSDVRNESLKSADVKNGSLLAADFAAGQLPAATTGATGPRGPSNGYSVTRADLDWNGATQVPVSLDLPAGNYLLFANTLLNNNSGVEEFIQCTLTLGGNAVLISNGEDVGPSSGDDREFLSLSGAGALAADGVATLTCNPNGAASGNYLQPTLTAIRVESLG